MIFNSIFGDQVNILPEFEYRIYLLEKPLQSQKNCYPIFFFTKNIKTGDKVLNSSIFCCVERHQYVCILKGLCDISHMFWLKLKTDKKL